jgi:hypothetical protein
MFLMRLGLRNLCDDFQLVFYTSVDLCGSSPTDDESCESAVITKVLVDQFAAQRRMDADDRRERHPEDGHESFRTNRNDLASFGGFVQCGCTHYIALDRGECLYDSLTRKAWIVQKERERKFKRDLF